MFLKGAFNFNIGNIFRQCFILNHKRARISVSSPAIEISFTLHASSPLVSQRHTHSISIYKSDMHQQLCFYPKMERCYRISAVILRWSIRNKCRHRDNKCIHLIQALSCPRMRVFMCSLLSTWTCISTVLPSTPTSYPFHLKARNLIDYIEDQ